MPLATLFDSGPPRPAKIRRRRAPSDSHIQYTRFPGKGRLEQIRLWLPDHGSINCGLYDAEKALVVRKKLITEMGRHPPTPIGVWGALRVVLDRLRAQGAEVPDVLPKYVERLPDGTFAARVKKGGRELELGPFATPEEAHESMVERIRVEFPAPVVEADRVTLLDYLGGRGCAAGSTEADGDQRP